MLLLEEPRSLQGHFNEMLHSIPITSESCMRPFATSLLLGISLSVCGTLLWGWPRGVALFAQDAANDEPKDLRTVVPKSDEQTKALAQVKEIFGDEYAKAKKPEDKAALARTLLKQAQDQTDDPIARYVLFKEAEKFATDGGDVESALSAVEFIGKEYQVDALERLHDVLEDFSKKAKTSLALKAINEANKAAIDKAVAEEKFAVATKFCVIGDKISLAAKDLVERKRYLDTKTSILTQQKEHEAAERAKEIIATNPEDPTANFDRGVYMLTRKQDWEAGLKHLAQCGDVALRALAKKDLANPESAKERLELADGWYEWTPPLKKPKPAWSKALAKHWYSQAATEVTGLDKTKVEKKLKEIGELPLSRDGSAQPAVVSVIKPRVEPTRTPPGTPALPNIPKAVGMLPQPVPNPYERRPLQPLPKDQAEITAKIAALIQRTGKCSAGYAFSRGGSFIDSMRQPPNEPFVIVTVNVGDIADDDLKIFEGFKTLGGVTINAHRTARTEWLKYFTASSYIRNVSFEGLNISDEDAELLPKFKNVTAIGGNMLRIGPKAVRAIGSLPLLEEARINVDSSVTADDLATLKTPNLKLIWLTSANDNQVSGLLAAPNLEELHLNSGTLTDAGIAKLSTSRFKSLRMFGPGSVNGTGFAEWKKSGLKNLDIKFSDALSEDGLAAVCNLTNLEKLDLGTCSAVLDLKKLRSAPTLKDISFYKINAADWRPLSSFPQLRAVGFESVQGVNMALKEFAKMPITSFGITDCDIGDEDLKPVIGHRTLRRVWLQRTKVTDAGVAALKATHPDMQVFYFK